MLVTATYWTHKCFNNLRTKIVFNGFFRHKFDITNFVFRILLLSLVHLPRSEVFYLISHILALHTSFYFLNTLCFILLCTSIVNARENIFDSCQIFCVCFALPSGEWAVDTHTYMHIKLTVYNRERVQTIHAYSLLHSCCVAICFSVVLYTAAVF